MSIAADNSTTVDQPGVDSAMASGRRAVALRADTLAASVILLLAMTAVQRVIGFGREIIFCRWLDLEQLGEWNVAFGFLTLAAPFAVLGLPGSFGRYVETYRQRGQLHAFLRRTTLVSALSSIVAVLGMAWTRHWFSQLIFGEAGQGNLVLWIVAALTTLVAHNFLCSLFVALRMYRVVNFLQFAQSVTFAALAVLFMCAWQVTATSAVAAFALATLVPCVASAILLRRIWLETPDVTSAPPRRDFWARLVPFAACVWITNLLANLFEVIDRYMIIHHSGMGVDEALKQVGYYHSSRIIPMLFVGVVALLGSILTPHLVYDWEAGRRTAVAARLNLALKLLAICLLALSVVVLVVAPSALFEMAFHNKFSGGLAVLPCTLAYGAWFGMFAVAQNYLWCAEKARLSTLALMLGLVVNVGLNLVLLPAYGLPGAVWATTAANLVALALVYALSALNGMQVERGTWILSLALLSLTAGPLAAAAVLAALVACIALSNLVFTANEKHELVTAFRNGIAKVREVTCA